VSADDRSTAATRTDDRLRAIVAQARVVIDSIEGAKPAGGPLWPWQKLVRCRLCGQAHVLCKCRRGPK